MEKRRSGGHGLDWLNNSFCPAHLRENKEERKGLAGSTSHGEPRSFLRLTNCGATTYSSLPQPTTKYHSTTIHQKPPQITLSQLPIQYLYIYTKKPTTT